MKVRSEDIRTKFGDNYIADNNTYKMGIDRRFTTHFAERFTEKIVLEICSGAGFSTISLAGKAEMVISVEIDPDHLKQAESNIVKAGYSEKIKFIHGDILDLELLKNLPDFDSAFLDPDWADSGPGHKYQFLNSNTIPPADVLLNRIFTKTMNIAMILPPYIEIREFEGLPEFECEKLFLGKSHELFCLYFGDLICTKGISEFKVPVN